MIVTAKCGHKGVHMLSKDLTDEETAIITLNTIEKWKGQECVDCRAQHRWELECRNVVALEAIALHLATLAAKPEPEEATPPTEKPRCTCTENPCVCFTFREALAAYNPPLVCAEYGCCEISGHKGPHTLDPT